MVSNHRRNIQTTLQCERQRARHIVESFGRSPNAFLALLSDKSYHFYQGTDERDKNPLPAHGHRQRRCSELE
jgi:hypothetical protein